LEYKTDVYGRDQNRANLLLKETWHFK